MVANSILRRCSSRTTTTTKSTTLLIATIVLLFSLVVATTSAVPIPAPFVAPTEEQPKLATNGEFSG
ncbi:hypothetical protein BG015_004015, partial [Linnemannia schmuckeri]